MTLHERLNTEEWRERIALHDSAFGAVCYALCVSYVFIQWRALQGRLSLLPFAALMAVVRISLAACGKSFLYGEKSSVSVILMFFMDVDYRGSALMASRLTQHERQRDSETINSLKAVPRLYRLPVDLCCQFLFLIESCLTPWVMLYHIIAGRGRYTVLEIIGFVLVRGMLIGEGRRFFAGGRLRFWLMQYFLTSILSFVLDICRCPTQAPSKDSDGTPTEVLSEPDVYLAKSPQLDCFLTSGLSCQRTRSLLPDQWSPFANIATEVLVKEICQEQGIEWKDPVHLVSQKLPFALGKIVCSQPDWKPNSLWTEHMSKAAFWPIVQCFAARILRNCKETKKPFKTD